MLRIILMVVRLFYKVPYYLCRIGWYGKENHKDRDKAYTFIQKVTRKANKAGRVTIEVHGLENIPKENGFVFSLIIRECLTSWCSWLPVRYLFPLYLRKR